MYDGKIFRHFTTTEEFVSAVYHKEVILYAHNGGKFDFLYLLPWITETKVQIINGRVVSMYLGAAELRDSYSIIPEPLKNFGAKKEIEYWKLEKQNREQYRDEILDYLETDCKVLFEATTAYRSIAGTQKTIAGNALKFAKSLGIQPGRTNGRFDKAYRHFFYGGRTEVFKPGTHKDISILDIHSAYPFAMLHEHATGAGDRFIRGFRPGETINTLTKDEIDHSFIILECRSKGAFPKRIIGPDGGLKFPHGKDVYFVTGWEYNVAMEFGLISDVEILSIRRPRNLITFKDYVEHWYKMKLENPKLTNKMNYTIAKIMMNSLYGKMAQDIARYYDYKIVPAGTKICFASEPDLSNPKYCKLCHAKLTDHGWEYGAEYEGREVHRRRSLWQWEYNYGEELPGKTLYNNVATGASITGFTRAHLLRAIHTIGLEHVIYCDTDSLIVDSSTDLSLLPISEKLGDWGIEDTNCPIGHFAGKKLYGVELSKEGKRKNSGEPYKIACKGSKLAFEDIQKIIRGETVIWRNEAPSFSLAAGKTPFGSKISGNLSKTVDGPDLFVVREIRSTFKTND